MVVLRATVVLLLAAEAAGGQMFFGCICSTDVPFATGPNNGHKLAFQSELIGMPDDTVTLVFQSSQSIHSCIGVFGPGGIDWTRPVLMYPGQNPAINFGADGDRHLVWQFPDTSVGWEVYYRNFEYRMMPVNVSRTMGNSMHPDVWADHLGLAHVVWEDHSHDKPRIYYRTCNVSGTVGDTFLVSVDTVGCCFLPSIEMFPADSALVVLWQQVDSGSYTPYSIRRRCCWHGVWQAEETLAQHHFPLRHPSLDCGSPWEGFSGAWEDSSSGNMEVHFEGGNPGGGYPTFGRSTAPVLATLGDVWSYLFWQEDSGGTRDILHHFNYRSGWYAQGSLRQALQIEESVRWPANLGALLVWTQGDAEPYKVMCAYFDYPIPVAEERAVPVSDRPVSVQPNPMHDRTVIRLAEGFCGNANVEVTDVTGRKIWSWTGTDAQVVWDGKGLPSGVYFVRARAGGKEAVAEVVKF